MQETATKPPAQQLNSGMPRLFREACYVDGQWVQAKSGAAINVDNPPPAKSSAALPKLGARKRASDRSANRAFRLGAKKTAKERAAVLRAGSN